MKFAGCDLHKQTITICVVDQLRRVLERRTVRCGEERSILAFFERLGEFEAVVEATASYEWFVRLIEPVAHRVLLAHPKKLRVIAESTRKSDRLDAQILAEFLALEMIPTSYRATPRQHEHRRLVRQRGGVQRRLTSVKNRLRRILCDYNADRPSLFTVDGLAYLAQVPLLGADRFAVDQMVEELHFGRRQLLAVNARLKEFAEAAPLCEQESADAVADDPRSGLRDHRSCAGRAGRH